ncbi:ATP-binding protein [Methylobacterium sp. NMS14P]|uniref:AAA family ATPase n=1 Tax=Methylobacterium sp. NMS14P TaxID=2894310 RepID=UPI00235866DC|nr:ATP-binding protein [Methylobacterium sp. NMS14P]WCS24830.1 ATP-binding protein [Methylobacterium sp. NMS14P]
MLRTLECSGFKSFDGFKIDFKPGLNVIVGPNGSGKTNIILFLQFLGSLRRMPLIEAIGQVGGAGTAFRRQKYHVAEDIRFKIIGGGVYFDYYAEKSFLGAYEYEGTVSFSTSDGSLVFKHQRLTGFIDRDLKGDGLFDKTRRPNFDIETRLNVDGNVDTVIHALDKSDLRYHKRQSEDEARFQISDTSRHLANNFVLYSYLDRIVQNADFPSQDLAGSTSYNILPSKVREPEDIASPATVQPDGSGFAATLYALQTDIDQVDHRYKPLFYNKRSFRNASSIRKQIISSGRLINDAISNINVKPDAFESKLRILVDLDYNGVVTRLPFSFVSDGTAKWYALVTAVITNRRLFAIEEPENFLHPNMQAEIVNLVRNQYSDRFDIEDNDIDRFAIVTTHSETILNHCRPDEIIVVSMDQGYTVASRASNSEDLDAEIRRTGFGLGYYYIAGAIE